MPVSKTIPIQNIPSFIKSSNHVFMSPNSLVIHPKFGKLVLDFLQQDVSSCIFRFKRVSGNGLMIITSDTITKELQVSSQTSQDVAFAVGPSGVVTIQRTARSSGDLGLLEIVLVSNADNPANIDWNSELQKARAYELLRISNGNLYASTGAFITSTCISGLATEPPGMFAHTDSGVKFTGSCRVVSLSIDRYEGEPPTQIVKHIEPEMIVTPPISEVVELAPATPTAPVVANSIYDTLTEGFNPAFCTRAAEASRQGVVIDFDGSYAIPLKMLTPNTGYTASIEIERVNGNGKFAFGILPDTESISVKVAAGGSRAFVCSVFVADSSLDYTFSIWRTSSSTGKIRVTRIVIKPNSSVKSSRHGFVNMPNYQHNVAFGKFSFTPNSKPIVVADDVRETYRSFAVLETEPYKSAQTVESSGACIGLNTFASRLWYSWMSPAVSNIKYSSNIPIKNAIRGDNSTTSVCSITKMPPNVSGKILFIEPFDGDIPQDSVSKIGQASKILTPSLVNKVQLSQHHNSVSISCLPFPIPLQDINRGYDVLNSTFCISEDANLRTVVDVWKSEYGTLKVFDPGFVLPDGIVPVSLYEPYESIVSQMFESKSFICLSKNTHYASGVIDMAILLGVPCITNNHHYLGIPGVKVVNASTLINIPEHLGSPGSTRGIPKWFDKFRSEFLSLVQ